MSRPRITRRTLCAAPLFAAAFGPAASAAPAVPPVIGESLVLPGTEPGQLWLGRLEKQGLVVRSTYRPDQQGTIVYVEGKDYAVNYEKGEVRRLEGSRIPDYTKNSLYGQKDFNHSKFPGFGNYRDFVFVDYQPRVGVAWPAQAAQNQLLARSWLQLRSGLPLKVVAFGDSITAGGDATAPELIFWQRWLDSLRKRYPKAEITGINGATGGDTTVQGLARLDDKVISQKPDLVLVAFGMNDQNIGSVPLAQFEKNLHTLVDRIRAGGPAEIVLVSSCLPNPSWHYTSGKMPEYGAVTRKVATEKGCAFADVLNAWTAVVDNKKPEDLLANNVNHPNDFGHWIYFRTLEKMGL